MKKIYFYTALCLLLPLAGCAQMSTKSPAPQETVDVYAVSAQGIQDKIGTITLKDSTKGLLIQTDLTDIPSGPHGFHIHAMASCEPAMQDGKMGAAMAAGGHFNPSKVAQHGDALTGHLGDLPVLIADDNGNAKRTLLAPRLQLKDVHQHAIMIHAGGDNYSDYPKPLGGGGARIACGVIG